MTVAGVDIPADCGSYQAATERAQRLLDPDQRLLDQIESCMGRTVDQDTLFAARTLLAIVLRGLSCTQDYRNRSYPGHLVASWCMQVATECGASSAVLLGEDDGIDAWLEDGALGMLVEHDDELFKVVERACRRDAIPRIDQNVATVVTLVLNPAARLLALKRVGESQINDDANRLELSDLGANVLLAPQRPFDEIRAELNSLVGLDEAKAAVFGHLSQHAISKKRREMGMKTFAIGSMHMLFMGRPGTGKTTFARLIGSLYASRGLLRKGHVVEVDRSNLVGAYSGHTARLVSMAIQQSKGGVLFVDEAYSLYQGDPRDNFGREALAALIKGMEDNRQDLMVIMAGYPNQMEVMMSSNPGLRSRFGLEIDFPDFNEDELWQVLTDMARSGGYEFEAGLEQEIRRSITEARSQRTFGNARYVRTLLEALVAQQSRRLEAVLNSGVQPTKDEFAVITSADLAEVLTSSKPTTYERGMYTRLVDKIKQRVQGQDYAVETVCKGVALARAGLDLRPHQPNGVYLLAGPTGTGKTELAKALAQALHGTEDALIRLDMSEYATQADVWKLLGNPGSEGYEGHGWLTTKVRERPDCVLLLDEMEKAHPEVWAAMLQVFDDGRLTSASGFEADFSDVSILMTSNLGASIWNESNGVGFAPGGRDFDSLLDQSKKQVVEKFSPEFINRLDAIVIFEPLSPATVAGVARSIIEHYCTGLAERGWSLEVSDAAIAAIADRGFSPEYGARYLQREIQSVIGNLLLDREPGGYAIEYRGSEFEVRDAVV